MRIKSFHQDQTEDDHENSGEQASPKENPVDFAAERPVFDIHNELQGPLTKITLRKFR
jgi:hypothetical protein